MAAVLQFITESPNLAAIIGGVAPAVVWLWFWLKEDGTRPEPKRLIVLSFLLGAMAVFLAFILERIALMVIAPGYSPADSLITLPFNQQVTVIITWSLIEEMIKYGLAAATIFRLASFDEPVDAMIYMITIALGFSAMENSLFLLNAGTLGGAAELFLTGNLRFLGATILHVVSSAVIGGMVALSFYAPHIKQIEYFLVGLCTATGLHALFNFFIISTDSRDIIKVLAFLWLSAILILLLFERVKRTIVVTTPPTTYV
ncbi:MAG: PrsW family intramembrane metalloprotease [Candidatus Vogelbacteria bacterium]|nr:PrsW family intramembrane metalloprotease [Candidatus Vogelbacteria bacterium]